MLNPQLLAVLRCPKCRGLLTERLDGETTSLDCAACNLRYAVEDEIPNLLIEEAQPLDKVA
jgi:uncharacterized protein YbaR (Trm112 family)